MKFNNFWLGLVSVFLTWILLVFFKTLVFFIFWSWFVTPVFTSLPSLTFLQSFGLMTFISMALKDELKIKSKDDNILTYTLSVILSLGMIMLFGYLVHLVV